MNYTASSGARRVAVVTGREARAGRRTSSAIVGTCFQNNQDQQNYFLGIVDTRSQAAHRRNATALVREQGPSTQLASGQSRALEYNVAF